MATYRELKGLTVPYLDSDLPPSSATTEEGSVWYNSATGKLRAFVSYDTWASGANFITNDLERMAGFGTQTACVSAGGYDPASPAGGRTYTYEYNGSGWSTNPSASMVAGYGAWGTGTSTAGLIWGGNGDMDESSEFDGSSWTEGGNLNTSRTYGCGGGTQTAGLAAGGTPPRKDESEEYDGSTWTEGNDLNNARDSAAGTGTQTACLAIGGNPVPTGVELYNGTSWTEVTNHPAPVAAGGSFGISTSAMNYGGEGASGTIAESWIYDGSTWAASTDMPYASYAMASVNSAPGGASSGLTWAGSGVGNQNTIEFQRSILTYTPAAWVTGPVMLSGNTQISCGTLGSKAGTIASGGAGTSTACETYDGTAWSETNDLNTGRYWAAQAGTTTAGLVTGGVPYRTETEEYDGTNWTESGDLPVGHVKMPGAGTQTAALTMGGEKEPSYTDSESCFEYNGTSWTAGGDMIKTSFQRFGAGTQTAALGFGGYTEDSIPPVGDDSEEYNGSSWTAGGTMLFKHGGATGAGTQIAAVGAAGYTTPPHALTVNTQTYDGTAFATSATINKNRGNTGGGGNSQAGAILLGGNPALNTTEEFEDGTSAAEAADIDFD